ncbi:hypothetical protein [Meiothermus rufus]|uniref:hypothetical protein n=1 Tax=Meiothermus rufus TaxID=604332 RepID=UPI000409450E|nr:hypothetical protein [Meiothermus rufus]
MLIPESILHELRAIRRTIAGVMIQYGHCPRCGRPLPAELERYNLERDDGPAVYCPCCGHEEARRD